MLNISLSNWCMKESGRLSGFVRQKSPKRRRKPDLCVICTAIVMAAGRDAACDGAAASHDGVSLAPQVLPAFQTDDLGLLSLVISVCFTTHLLLSTSNKNTADSSYSEWFISTLSRFFFLPLSWIYLTVSSNTYLSCSISFPVYINKHFGFFSSFHRDWSVIIFSLYMSVSKIKSKLFHRIC